MFSFFMKQLELLCLFLTESSLFPTIKEEIVCQVRALSRVISSDRWTIYAPAEFNRSHKSQALTFIRSALLQVTAVILKDGRHLAADMVVVGIGIRANTVLFEGQLTMVKGGIKVDGRMQTSNSSVYAVGDVAAFPIKLFGSDVRRLEHVDCARKTARHAVAAIMAPRKTGDIDYLPFFYSRVFALSWQFYGDNVGEVVHFGDFSSRRFGAYWVDKGRIMGAFLESGSREEYEAIAKAVKLKATVKDMTKLEGEGLAFAFQVSQQAEGLERLTTRVCHASAGVAVALSIAAFAYWCDAWHRIW